MTVDVDALRCAQRLSDLGIVVRSPELSAQAKRLNEFSSAGGNRAMRRAAARAAKKSGAVRAPRAGKAKVR